ncbi:MAG: nucleotidyltransferase domain-containing protein [Eggerthellaceae bacterium]|nr:nucleotidyltransferase domain-containing protein [Eggerthellaceae bacterium]
MVDVEAWMKKYSERLHEAFGDRVWFVGLQGSYARGEATEASDIDAVAILDAVTVADIHAYGAMLDALPNRDLTCGFFGGKEELLNWEPSELFQFYHDTIPILGSLDGLLDVIDPAAIDRAILQSACCAYHGCIHNMLFEKDEAVLAGLYKSASFAVQASVFRKTGRYFKSLNELQENAVGSDREVLGVRIALKSGASVDFAPMSEILLSWAQEKIR